jgi:hypothetical protein
VSEREKLLSKIAKLKALSECQTGNVNEAATAASAMARLMLEHQIEIEEVRPLGEERKALEVTKDSLEQTLPTWQGVLVNQLAKVNNCQAYTTSLTRKGKKLRLNLVGEREDIENVKTLFTYCVSQITRLCDAWAGNLPGQTKRKNDFKFGASSAVCKRLREMREEVTREHSCALTLFDAKAVAVRTFLASTGVNLNGAGGKASVRSPNQSAYVAGQQAGQGMSLNPNYLRGGQGQRQLIS